MKTAIKNILFPVISAVLLIVVEKVIERLMEETDKKESETAGSETARVEAAAGSR